MNLLISIYKIEKLQLGVVVKPHDGDHVTRVRTCVGPLYYTAMCTHWLVFGRHVRIEETVSKNTSMVQWLNYLIAVQQTLDRIHLATIVMFHLCPTIKIGGT